MTQSRITPGARISGRLCTCGHRAGLHDRYMTGPCRAKDGLGRAEKPCKCKRFVAEKPQVIGITKDGKKATGHPVQNPSK